MKKIIFKSIKLIAVMALIISCSDNKEVITEKEVTIEELRVTVDKLPKNAIKADKILFQEKLYPISDNSYGFGLDVKALEPNQYITYERYFVVYPDDWSIMDRLQYLKSVRLHREVFVVNDDCDDVDTWWIQVIRVYPEMPNKTKNVVVTASSTNTDLDDLDEDSDDGPGEIGGNVFIPSNCHEALYDGGL